MKVVGEFINLMSWVLVVCALGAGVYLHWEDRQPVMRSVYVKPGTSPVVTSGSVVIHLAGYKELEHCKKIPFSDVGYAIIDDFKREASFRYVDDETPMSTFDGGKLDMGEAEFSSAGIERASYIGWSFKHTCHDVEKDSPTYWIKLK